MAPRKTAKDKKPATPRKTTATASKVTKRAPAKKSAAKPQSPTKDMTEPTMAPATKKRGRPPGTTKAAKAAKTTEEAEDALLFVDAGPDTRFITDPDHSIDDIVAGISRRRLTKLDRVMLAGIEDYEKEDKTASINDAFDQVYEQRREAFLGGKVLKCHVKIYTLFMSYEHALRTDGRWSAKSPSRAASKSLSEIPKANAKARAQSTARGKSASPIKATSAARGKSVSPIKTSAAARRSASKSPSKATARRSASKSPSKATARSRSKSPVKDTMTRPMRPTSPSKSPMKMTKAAQKARLNADDEYGQAMRKVEQSIYASEKYGHGSAQHMRSGLTQKTLNALAPEDYDYAEAKGAARAAMERDARELGDNDEQAASRLPDVDAVNNYGVVANQRSAGRGSKTMTRRTVSPSPTKGARNSASSQIRRSPSKSPTKTAAAPSTARRSSSKSPTKASAALVPLPANQASKEGHGTLRSPTNPEFLTHNGKPFKKNVFFETMPAAEVWHRNMPSFFSFGETPYMERIMSQQMEEDLTRSQEEIVAKPKSPNLASKFFSALRPLPFVGGSKKPEPEPRTTKDPAEDSADKIWTMWDLPKLTEEEKAEALA